MFSGSFKSHRSIRAQLAKPEILPIKATDPSVQNMIKKLDLYLESLYPPEENHLDSVEVLSGDNCAMLGAFVGHLLVGMGAIKIKGEYAELKRMFVDPMFRRLGISKALIEALEEEALKKEIDIVRLETGKLQNEAVKLYEKWGYQYISPFGEYSENASSVFMERKIKKFS